MATGESNPHYQLFRGDVLLGVVEHTEDDFPLHVGRFQPAPAFEAVRMLFEREVVLLELSVGPEWSALRDEINAPGLRLVRPDGSTLINNPTLHIRGAEVWWR